MVNSNFQIGERESDPSVCGKRKRGEIQETLKIDSGGEIAKIDSDGEIAKIDSGGGSAMAEEKETRHVKKFQDKYGLFQRYEGKMAFEHEDYDPLRRDDDYFSDDGEANLYMVEEIEKDDMVEEIKNDGKVEETDIPYVREAVLKYISQVRNSFGFDVDVRVPSWLVDYLKFIPLEVSHPLNRDYVYEAARFAIDEINVDMKSKTYELVEVAKAVAVYVPCSLKFLTLVVKKVEEEEAVTLTIQAIVYRPTSKPYELDQWMVKPDAEP